MIGKVRLPPRPQLQHFKRPILFQLAQQVHAQTFCVAIIPSIWAALDYFICTIKLIQPKRFNSECLFKRCGEKQSLPESQFNFFSSTCFVLFFLGGAKLATPTTEWSRVRAPVQAQFNIKSFQQANLPASCCLFSFFSNNFKRKKLQL